MNQQPAFPEPVIDHIIYCAQDLNDAIDQLEQLLGVRATIGGQHPGRETHNALLSLGPGAYMEIIAPDPDQPQVEQPLAFGLDTLKEPGLKTWAARPHDIEATAAWARQNGYDPGKIVSGSRARPDGVLLAWRTTSHPQLKVDGLPPGDGLVPFLIDWGETPHPSSASPQGCRLISLTATHPEPDKIRDMLSALNISIAVDAGETPRLLARIDTPRGQITLPTAS